MQPAGLALAATGVIINRNDAREWLADGRPLRLTNDG
jgi:hypothetical protein